MDSFTDYPADPAPPAIFHLDTLASVQAVGKMLEDTCLDLHRPWFAGDRGAQFADNSLLFSGGSAPRDVWAQSGLGATIDACVVATGAPLVLIDLCSMTANTVLGINDPWVKLKQAAYLLSQRPHYVTARMGTELTYR